MPSNPRIPDNYQSVMVYLVIKDALNFIAFTQEVFGAVLTNKTMREENILMHGEIMIGDTTIMFADATDVFGENPAGLFVYVDNADDTYRKALDAGATVVTPLADQSYGRSGGVKDPHGNTWWITALTGS